MEVFDLYLKRHKAKDRLYYYLFVHDRNELYEEKRIYSLGNGQKALKKLTEWGQNAEIPE